MLIRVDRGPGARRCRSHRSQTVMLMSDLRGRLRGWLVPFADETAAHAFFFARYGNERAARAWTAGLERVTGGLSARFDPGKAPYDGDRDGCVARRPHDRPGLVRLHRGHRPLLRQIGPSNGPGMTPARSNGG